MVHEENTIVDIKLEKELVFKCNLGLKNLKEIYIDETINPKGELVGPDAARLLGMAILGCLSASFIFCLQKRNLVVDDLDASAEISFGKTEKEHIRVKKINIKITPKTKDPATLKRIKQCISKMKTSEMLFEETCIITGSVREGIHIDVNVEI